MRNLITFLVKHRNLFLYLFYVVGSLAMLFTFNPYHQSIYLNSSNGMVGGFYSVFGNLSGYFNLYTVNEELLHQNSQLEMELQQLQEVYARLDTTLTQAPISWEDNLPQYNYTEAHVVNNSLYRTHNYITLNKGTQEGVQPKMGVVDHNGVVGVVSSVSEHYAVVISLLNPILRLSCKVKGLDYVGSLVWDGADHRYGILEELPHQAVPTLGDTVITTGYSALFPEGVVVGYVSDLSTAENGDQRITVAYAAQFEQLNYVQVIENREQKEQHQLESSSNAPQ